MSAYKLLCNTLGIGRMSWRNALSSYSLLKNLEFSCDKHLSLASQYYLAVSIDCPAIQIDKHTLQASFRLRRNNIPCHSHSFAYFHSFAKMESKFQAKHCCLLA